MSGDELPQSPDAKPKEILAGVFGYSKPDNDFSVTTEFRFIKTAFRCCAINGGSLIPAHVDSFRSDDGYPG
jgi:hypothetical protein